jgi:hypothetical protein
LAELAIGGLRLVPLLLLFVTGIRRSADFLRGIAVANLLGTAIEMAWLVFPATETAVWSGAVTELLALAVLTAASIGLFAWATQGGLRRWRRSAS